MEPSFTTHTDFDKILAEIAELKKVDKTTANEITTFVNKIRDLTHKVEPDLKMQHDDERYLWNMYRRLQQKKLVRLDLSHEYEPLQAKVKKINPKLDFLVEDALEELKDHIEVVTETQRAHIDILEIFNTRRIEVLALLITAVISYLAVWEFFVRDILQSIIFPANLSPNLNYLLVIITLLPIFIATTWAWRNRGKRF